MQYMRAIILRWIPWCWKSTLAEKYSKEWFVVISKDRLREQNKEMSEKQVSLHRDTLIKSMGRDKKNIVIDETNLSPNTLQWHIDICKSVWFEVDVVDVFAWLVASLGELWALNECILRNKKRIWASRVPDSVIYEMYLKSWYKLTDKKIVVFDLDWTLFNIEHRLHWIEKNRWDKFESDEEIANDSIYSPVADIVEYMSKDFYVIYLSWRKNTFYDTTRSNLDENGLFKPILMRNYFDSRKDADVKSDLIDLISKNHSIYCAFDDRKQVIDVWKSKWIYVFNCCQRESNDF